MDKDLILEIEHKMEETAKIYLTTTVDFIKWNTAFAVGAFLWFGNFLISPSNNLTYFQRCVAFIIMLFLLATIVTSIVVFYGVSKYWNNYWSLYFRWQNSLKNDGESLTPQQKTDQNKVITDLCNTTSVNQVKGFDTAIYIQMILLIIGLSLMGGFNSYNYYCKFCQKEI